MTRMNSKGSLNVGLDLEISFLDLDLNFISSRI
jgi:hypothetical protein